MSQHFAGVRWRRATPDFAYESYNRSHEVMFNSGTIMLPASAAPAFHGDRDRVDPEEAFVASLASCHMLSFLAICARKRLTVDAYEDEAVGDLAEDSRGKLWVARVLLRPNVRFAAEAAVSSELLDSLHHRAHEECFIARSVRTEVRIEPQK